MNIYLYLSLVILLGVAFSVYAARLGAGSSMARVVVLYGALSICLGIFLTIPMLQLVAGACSLLGISKETSCIATDERTVWYLGFPLIAFPLYFIVMLASRLFRARAGETVVEARRGV